MSPPTAIYHGIDNADARWSKFEVKSLSRGLSWNEDIILQIDAAASRLHARRPFIRLTLELDRSGRWFTVQFVDGNVWKVCYHDKSTTPLMHFDLADQAWSRHLLMEYVFPVDEILCNAGARHGIDGIKLEPRDE